MNKTNLPAVNNMLGLKGYSYLWLLIIVIIGSFFMAGGQFMFEDLNNLGIEPSISPVKGAVPPGGANPPPTEWKVLVQNTICTSATAADASITTQALANGYLVFQISNGTTFVNPQGLNGIYTFPVTAPGNTTNYSNLGPAYRTNKWKLILYEGGTLTNGNLTPGTGTERASLEVNPITCSTP